MTNTDQARPADADATLSLIKKNAELEKECKELKLKAGKAEMRLGVAEKKLSETEERLASISPATLNESIESRVKRVVEELQELREQNAALRSMRAAREAQRVRWRQIVDGAASHSGFTPEDAPLRAKAAARYADQLLEEEDQRFRELPLVVQSSDPAA